MPTLYSILSALVDSLAGVIQVCNTDILKFVYYGHGQ